MRTGQAGLHSASDIAVVQPIVEIAVLSGGQGHSEAVDRVVVAPDRAEQSGIDEDRRIKQSGYRRDIQCFVVGRNGASDVVKIVSRYNLPDPKDKPIVEQSLPIPQLVKLGTIQRFGATQTVVALHTTGLTIGVLTVESKKLNPERGALPGKQLFGIEICTDDQRAIPTPFARLFTSGQQTIRVHKPKATKSKAAVLWYLQQPAGQAGPGQNVLSRRVAGDCVRALIDQRTWLGNLRCRCPSRVGRQCDQGDAAHQRFERDLRNSQALALTPAPNSRTRRPAGHRERPRETTRRALP